MKTTMLENLKWMINEKYEAEQKGELNEEQMEEFILGLMSCVATEYVLEIVGDTELSYFGDKFAELTHASRCDYYKNVDESKGGFKGLFED